MICIICRYIDMHDQSQRDLENNKVKYFSARNKMNVIDKEEFDHSRLIEEETASEETPSSPQKAN